MYGQLPVVIGEYPLSVSEMMFYQYLPIKVSGQPSLPNHNMEQRLEPFAGLVGTCCCDFIAKDGIDRFVDSYVYLTAKRLFVSPEYNMNREGWHSDGFMTEDINYIWSDCIPTIFSGANFELTQDDKVSLKEMEEQADPKWNVHYPDNTLLRLDQYNIHKCGQITKGIMRTFFKLSISLEPYDLVGNSINYRLDYSWKYKMRPRNQERNIPQKV